MALSLESAQTVAIGAFNPHIINPPWLVKNRICEDGEVEFRVVSTPTVYTGVAFRIKDVQWQIDFQTLMVMSQKQNCGEMVGKVIARLPHTPVRAVGNNFHYAGSMDQWVDGPRPMLGTKGWDAFADVGSVSQKRWGGVFHHDDARMEVTLAQSDAGMAALFNFHRDTKTSKAAQLAARQFDKDGAASRELLERLFQQRIAP